MKQHAVDLVALVFGVAFAIAGGVIILGQTTSVDVGPGWGIAIVAIAVGTLTLLGTVARSGRDTDAAPASVASSEPADDVADG